MTFSSAASFLFVTCAASGVLAGKPSPVSASRRAAAGLSSIIRPRPTAFLHVSAVPSRTTTTATTTAVAPPPRSTSTSLPMAKKATKKKKKKSGGGGGGLKGFGSSSGGGSSAAGAAASAASSAEIDKSRDALAFYDYLERNGAGSNLKRVGLARFPIGSDADDGNAVKIRGVVALRPIKKGEAIIDVPYELAMNLGRESADPTLPAVQLLQEYCRWISGGAADKSTMKKKRDDSAYLKLLPTYMGSDCLGSTDFFDDDALDALQYPPVKDETLRRRETTCARFERDVEPMTQISDNMYRWEDGTTPITELHLRWAVWLITSRVLTVQGEEGTAEAFRLMIPLIDMCNHDRFSVHVLTGRAVPGGSLKVVAGRNVEPGEQINICYGGGVAGNDRFVQDYGFLDSFDDGTAYDLVAKVLTGRSSRGEFGFGGGASSMSASERAETMEALGTTTLEEDEAMLSRVAGDGDGGGVEMDGAVRTAVEYRVGVKKALARLEGV